VYHALQALPTIIYTFLLSFIILIIHAVYTIIARAMPARLCIVYHA